MSVLRTDIMWEQVPVQSFLDWLKEWLGLTWHTVNKVLVPHWLNSGSLERWVRILTLRSWTLAVAAGVLHSHRQTGTEGWWCYWHDTKIQRQFRSIPVRKSDNHTKWAEWRCEMYRGKQMMCCCRSGWGEVKISTATHFHCSVLWKEEHC